MVRRNDQFADRWRRRLVTLTFVLLCVSLPIFLAAGYIALYWAWLRGDVEKAIPYLPWARNFGMTAMAAAAVALAILFLSNSFSISPKTRLRLSLLSTATIAFFSEFRNEGKFHLKVLVHFFAPGTWIHNALNRVSSLLGDFVYRLEYSHWNDFLMGPAIVSVLFLIAYAKIYGAFRNQGLTSITAATSEVSTDLDQTLRFARILMNVGLFWFFIQAWAEKAGYLRNPHSSDEIDLPFEFAGTMLGFWMARVLTKPFDERTEKFRSTFVVDFVAAGVIGLLYTLVVGKLTEGVASSVGHALNSVVPSSLDQPEITPLQRYMRPFELLLLAGAMWWSLNRISRHEEITRLSSVDEETERDSRWGLVMTVAQPLAVISGYLLVLIAMLSVLEPQGVGWTMATMGIGTGVGTAALFLLKRVQQGTTTLLGGNDDRSG